MRVRLVTEEFTERPAFDTAISHALLRRAAAGEAPETLRLHRPGSVVAFGRQDTVSPGYRSAVEAARSARFEAVERLAGGRAAVFHTGTIAFSWTVPTPTPRQGIRSRFETLSDLMVNALRGLGIDARRGEVPGEYCPGEHSVNVGGVRKVMGVGQRIAGRAAHVGGVVVVDGGRAVAEVLQPVYAALGLAWDPQTSGDLTGCAPDLTYGRVREAILAEFDNRFGLVEGTLDDETRSLAAQLEEGHLAPR